MVPVAVPAVVVTLLDRNGQGIYEWSVSPSVQDLMAGERADVRVGEAHHHLVPAQHLPEGSDRGGEGEVAARGAGGL